MPARLDWTDVLAPHPKAPSVHRPCEPVTLPRSVALSTATARCWKPLPACGSARNACQDPERPSLGFPFPGPV